MITHKVSIVLQRESNEQFSSSHMMPPRKTISTNRWEILISGDPESDDPMDASPMLQELQKQVEKIREAYGYK